jgi:hypothetical protein
MNGCFKIIWLDSYGVQIHVQCIRGQYIRPLQMQTPPPPPNWFIFIHHVECFFVGHVDVYKHMTKYPGNLKYICIHACKILHTSPSRVSVTGLSVHLQANKPRLKEQLHLSNFTKKIRF